MEGIGISSDQVLPLDSVAPGVRGLRIAFVNLFGVSNPDGSWVLVDCGLPLCENYIYDWAMEHFHSAPQAIVLTHGHFDHAGSAKALTERWSARIYAHREEHPYLDGEKEYPSPNFSAGGGLMTLLSPLLPRGPYELGDRLQLITEEVVPELPGWRVILTPGHTPGHISLFRPEDRTLLAGDAFCTTKPESFFEAAIAREPELHGPPAYFTMDWNQAQESVYSLAILDPVTVAPGHGRPMRGESLPGKLREMAWRFKELAVPENRRPSAA